MKINEKLSSLMAAIFVLVILVFAAPASAAIPTISLSANSDGNAVQLTVNGDANASVLFFYHKTDAGQQIESLGTTSSSGYFSASLNVSTFNVASGSTVYVRTGGLNGTQSNIVDWPNVLSNGVFALNPTGAVLTVGQTSTISASNTGGKALYLSNNSNPPVANANISGSQVSIVGISNGSSVISICLQGSSPTTCASVYVTVQNDGTQALSFSISNVSVAPGQSVPVTISQGSGSYTVLNNSNSSVIQTNISGSIITLTTAATSGTSAITVCSSNMSACGIINATASSVSTVPLAFSQTSPVISAGQSLSITISGGATTGSSSATYYVSSNSNESAVGTFISGNSLTLTGKNNGTANITVCSSGASCGVLNATINYVSSGGPVTLSQSSISMLVGQVLSITVSGGTSPYNLYPATGQNIFQASLNGNIISISGISAGSSSLNVCSTGGACVILSIIVNASGAGTPMSFSQSSLSLGVGGATAITVSGGGGYYVSTNSNSSIASVQISGNTAVVSALASGNANISICQSGGQCSILSVSVSGSSGISIPTFSQASPLVAAGQVLTITVSGGTSGSYYILSNTNPNAAQLSLDNGQLKITGLMAGSTTIVVCAASDSCGVLTATVSGTAASQVYFTSTSVSAGTVGQAYSAQLSASGGNGSYTYSLTSGNLPSGLTLSASGLISGTPSGSGTSNATIKVTDSSGNSASLGFTFTVNSQLAMPTGINANTGANAATFTNGKLILEDGTIYMVYKNTKVGFTNAEAFLGLGFTFDKVVPATNSGLAVSEKVVETAQGAHPRGTWLISGSTVYFLTPEGLIPVPTWDNFLNNGGQAEFIVKANSYDLNRVKLSAMVLDDARLK